MILKTRNENTYLLSAIDKPILFMPPEFAESLSNDKNSYYKKKRLFLEEHGFLFGSKEYETKTTFQTSISKELVKSFFSNCVTIAFEVTEDCNLHCDYCIYGENYKNRGGRASKNMDFLDAQATIDFVLNLKKTEKNVLNTDIYINFYGGEPLLNIKLIKNIVDYCEQIKQIRHNLNFIFSITTNGLLIDKYIDFLERFDFQILISLDGNRKNNQYRKFKDQTESFDFLIKNIKFVQKNHLAFFKKNIRFNTVLHDKNSYSEILSFFKENNLKKPGYTLVNSNINNDKFRPKARLSPEEILQQNGESAFVEIGTAYTQFFDLSFNHFSTYRSLTSKKTLNREFPTGTCLPATKKIFITAQGKIFPCETIEHTYPLGSVENGIVNISFEYIAQLYSDLFKKINQQCAVCDLREFCAECVFLDLIGDPEKLRCSKRKKLHEGIEEKLSFLEKNPEINNKIWKKYYYV